VRLATFSRRVSR
jgi:hypothetical protein